MWRGIDVIREVLTTSSDCEHVDTNNTRRELWGLRKLILWIFISAGIWWSFFVFEHGLQICAYGEIASILQFEGIRG